MFFNSQKIAIVKLEHKETRNVTKQEIQFLVSTKKYTMKMHP